MIPSSVVHASLCGLGELWAIRLFPPFLGWGGGCDLASSLLHGGGSGWRSCTSSGAWAGHYAPFRDLAGDELGHGPELHGGQGAPGTPTLLPVGVAPALSLVYLLGKFPLPGEEQWTAGFLGGKGGGGIAHPVSCREKRTCVRSGLPWPRSWGMSGGLQS